MAMVGGIAAGLLTSLVGIGSSSAQSGMSNRAAANQRGWQEWMSDTAFQRAVRDMKAAGLNPAMMYMGGGGGASTPGGAMAQTPDLGGVVSSAMQASKLREELDILAEQKKNLVATGHNTAADTQKKQSEVELNNHIGDQIRADTKWKEANSALAEASLPEARASAKFWEGQGGETMKTIQKILEFIGLGRKAVGAR